MFLSTFSLLAQNGAAAPAKGQSLWQTLIFFGVAILFFYFILMRPESKRRKAMEKKRGEMKKGDKATAMGIIGTVVKVGEQTVILRMYDGAKIEVLKGAITDVTPATQEEAEKIEKEEAKQN